MQILQLGNGVQEREWKVRQTDAAGYCRVYFIKSGEVMYFDDRMEQKLVPGRLYVFPSQQPYNLSHNPEKPIDCLWFHMDMFPYDIDRLLPIYIIYDCFVCHVIRIVFINIIIF